MASISGVLNTVVPWIILLVFAAIFYVALKKPIDTLLGWIKSLFTAASEKIVETTADYDINYRNQSLDNADKPLNSSYSS